LKLNAQGIKKGASVLTRPEPTIFWQLRKLETSL